MLVVRGELERRRATDSRVVHEDIERSPSMHGRERRSDGVVGRDVELDDLELEPSRSVAKRLGLGQIPHAGEDAVAVPGQVERRREANAGAGTCDESGLHGVLLRQSNVEASLTWRRGTLGESRQRARSERVDMSVDGVTFTILEWMGSTIAQDMEDRPALFPKNVTLALALLLALGWCPETFLKVSSVCHGPVTDLMQAKSLSFRQAK